MMRDVGRGWWRQACAGSAADEKRGVSLPRPCFSTTHAVAIQGGRATGAPWPGRREGRRGGGNTRVGWRRGKNKWPPIPVGVFFLAPNLKTHRPARRPGWWESCPCLGARVVVGGEPARARRDGQFARGRALLAAVEMESEGERGRGPRPALEGEATCCFVYALTRAPSLSLALSLSTQRTWWTHCPQSGAGPPAGRGRGTQPWGAGGHPAGREERGRPLGRRGGGRGRAPRQPRRRRGRPPAGRPPPGECGVRALGPGRGRACGGRRGVSGRVTTRLSLSSRCGGPKNPSLASRFILGGGGAPGAVGRGSFFTSHTPANSRAPTHTPTHTHTHPTHSGGRRPLGPSLSLPLSRAQTTPHFFSLARKNTHTTRTRASRAPLTRPGGWASAWG